MDLPAKVLMQIARRKLMIKAMPSSYSGSSLYDSATSSESSSIRIVEQAIQVLERLIRLCNSSTAGSSSIVGASTASLRFNHAQCRFLDLQSFHDNLRNLVDEMASLDSTSCEQCRTAAVEIAKVTRDAEVLVSYWVSSGQEDAEDSWLMKAIVYAADDGIFVAQQYQHQQWCVSVMEVVLAQFRAGRDDSFKHQKKRLGTGSYQHHIPYWMIERTFEIAEETLNAEADRGLILAMRLDRRNLLDKLRKMKQKHDGFFFRGLAVFSSKSRKENRVAEITSYLIAKLDTEDDGFESYIERIHQRESWALDNITSRRTENLLLGTGFFGIVYKSEFLGFPAALKVTAFLSRESFWNEVSVLASLRHPRLAQLLFASITNDDEEFGECRLWTELLRKDLDSVLNLGQGPVPLPVAVEIMLQVAEGMAFLHRRGVLHRCLNAFNVLLVPSTTDSRRRRRSSSSKHELDEFIQVKITDYGLPKTRLAGSSWLQSVASDDDDQETFESQQQRHDVPPFWQAPEVFEQQEASSSGEATFTKKSDVYSFGMLCFQILSSRRPFSDYDQLTTESQLFQLVSVERGRPDILGHSPAFLAVLARRCWSHEPEQRLSFTQVCLALRSLKAIIARRQSWQHQDILPLTMSDFSQLASHLGVKFLVDVILMHNEKQQRQREAGEGLFISMLEKEKGPGFWPFPMDSFVLWLASSVEQLEHEDGFGAAAEIAGDLMANWIGPGHEFEQAVFWYYKASSCAGGGSARWKLAMCLESGLGIARDEKRALGLYKQAAREGCASAHVELGRCYQSGRGVEASDPDKAVAHFAKALEILEKTKKEQSSDGGDGSSLDCVELLMRMLAMAGREEDSVWAADKLQEIAARSRLGRVVVAGPDCCNVRELVGMLGDWQIKEVSRRRAKMVLERLAVEDDILQQALLA
ncbi:uncharacterized protein LOC112344899 [Selaginella moellendorffii]|uniref:uncharacterized protein LOC112344899 n=1 Tax=Selaginella moellendorffii TaxID=88036 RepID=UPI000D1C603E|nr:uncharacterized protein LOC112344899 [Selaginella moellendorffii]|eukprot:XP_024526212.1 uncharacterized protein LOC112344899 [Selaginella moellendorffii]